MKHVANFIIGIFGTFVVASKVNWNSIPPEVLDGFKAFLSTLGGVISSLIMFYLNRWLTKQKQNENTNLENQRIIKDEQRDSIPKSVDKSKLQD